MHRVTRIRDLTDLGVGKPALEILRMRDEDTIERSCDEQHRYIEARQIVEQRRLRTGPEAPQARGERAGVVGEALPALRRDEFATEPPLRREDRLREPFVDESFDAIRLDAISERFIRAETDCALRGIFDAGARADQQQRRDALGKSQRERQRESRTHRIADPMRPRVTGLFERCREPIQAIVERVDRPVVARMEHWPTA